jgi:hypothetical protein
MNLYDVFQQVNFLTNKDQSGYTFTPEEFSRAATIAQSGYYTAIIAQLRATPINQKMDIVPSEFNSLVQLVKSAVITPPFNVPSDFMFEKALTVGFFDVELLDPKRYNYLVHNPFYENSRAFAKVEQGQVVISNNPTTATLVYYRLPLNVYFDYVFDVNGVFWYMEPGSWLVTNGANLDLVRAVTQWATSTAYSVGTRVMNLGIAYKVITEVLNTDTTPPAANPKYQSLGDAIIMASVTHTKHNFDGYVSQSVELDLPIWAYEEFVQKVYQIVMINRTGGFQQKPQQ